MRHTNKFMFDSNQSFQRVEKAMIDTPVLGHANLRRPFHLFSDASDKAVDASKRS